MSNSQKPNNKQRELVEYVERAHGKAQSQIADNQLSDAIATIESAFSSLELEHLGRTEGTDGRIGIQPRDFLRFRKHTMTFEQHVVFAKLLLLRGRIYGLQNQLGSWFRTRQCIQICDELLKVKNTSQELVGAVKALRTEAITLLNQEVTNRTR